MFRKIKHIHFVGIGGIGMSGIAEVMLNLGYIVSGSDIKESDVTRRLRDLGGEIYIGHRAENIRGVHVVVVSSAIKKENIEIIAAKERLIPVIPRAEMLAELMRLKYGVAVAGAHGKTTTTSMISSVLGAGGFDPTVVIGGKLNILGTNAKLGQGDFMVAEADESDGSFLSLSPTIAVVTTIDREHLDFYKDIGEIKRAFLQFINSVPFYGVAILCLDDKHIQSLIPFMTKRYATYGVSTQADFVAKNIKVREMVTEFEALSKDRSLGRFKVNLPGVHNAYNALASIAVGLELEIDIETIREALADFNGVHRRFQLKGIVGGIMLIDDYGHHPTEIKMTLSAAKDGWDRRTVVLFQPHRYTRTKDLMEDFSTAFYLADKLVLTEIYPAGEERIDGVSAYNLYKGIKEHGHKDVIYIGDKEKIVRYLIKELKDGDIFMTLGAGDVWKIGEEILKKLEVRSEK